jgi:hypothetical protein
MAWTQADLDALDKALKSGVLQVQRGDRLVKYRDLDEMLRVREMIRAELGLTETNGISVQTVGFSKGIE